MKSHLTIAAAATLLALALMPVSAHASCQNICVRGYNACLASGIPQSECQAELSQCLADCGGGGGLACSEGHAGKDEPNADGTHQKADTRKAKTEA
jgi:hypothetical protein